MSTLYIRLIVVLATLVLVAACAPAETPTARPTQTAPASAPAAAKPTAAPAATQPAAAPPTVAATAPAATGTPAAKIKRGGTIVHAITNPSSLDPIMTTNSAPLVESPIYEALLRYDLVDEKSGKHELKGELAESWKIVDPKTIEFKLRQGVKFHDGSPLTAEVVKWNLDRVGGNAKSMAKNLTSAVASTEIVDASTVRLKLKDPSATQLLYLTRASGGTGSSGTLIVSKAAADKLGEDAFGAQISATGPMILTEWKRDDRVLMKKFDGYWGKGADGQALPYVDSMTARIIADRAVALIEVKAGAADSVVAIDGKDIAGVKSNPELVYWELPWATNFTLYGFNQQKAPFQGNLKFRQALAYAIDREAMAKTLGFGAGVASYYPYWNSTFPGWDTTLPKYDFSLDKAAQLMKESGVPEGTEFSSSIQSTSINKQQAEMVQAMFDKIKVKLRIEAMELLAWRQHMKNGSFESSAFGMDASPDPDMFQRGLVTDKPSNWLNYSSPELDKCMIEGSTLYDEKQRTEVYKKCQRIIYEDAIVLGAYMTNQNVVYRKNLKGVRVQTRVIDLAQAWQDK